MNDRMLFLSKVVGIICAAERTHASPLTKCMQDYMQSKLAIQNSVAEAEKIAAENTAIRLFYQYGIENPKAIRKPNMIKALMRELWLYGSIAGCKNRLSLATLEKEAQRVFEEERKHDIGLPYSQYGLFPAVKDNFRDDEDVDDAVQMLSRLKNDIIESLEVYATFFDAIDLPYMRGIYCTCCFNYCFLGDRHTSATPTSGTSLRSPCNSQESISPKGSLKAASCPPDTIEQSKISTSIKTPSAAESCSERDNRNSETAIPKPSTTAISVAEKAQTAATVLTEAVAESAQAASTSKAGSATEHKAAAAQARGVLSLKADASALSSPLNREIDNKIKNLTAENKYLNKVIREKDIKLSFSEKDAVRSLLQRLTSERYGYPLSELFLLLRSSETPPAIQRTISNLFLAFESMNVKTIKEKLINTTIEITKDNADTFDLVTGEDLAQGDLVEVQYPGYRIGNETVVRPVAQKKEVDKRG